MRLDKDDLPEIVLKALRHHGGRAKLVDVARYIWENHESSLRASGDMFFTWQYDMRWAAQRLRNEGALKPGGRGSRFWEVATSANST